MNEEQCWTEMSNKLGMKGSPFQMLKMNAFSIPDLKKD